jgi:hypothetical protein
MVIAVVSMDKEDVLADDDVDDGVDDSDGALDEKGEEREPCCLCGLSAASAACLRAESNSSSWRRPSGCPKPPNRCADGARWKSAWCSCCCC